jgi:hypothetical protein
LIDIDPQTIPEGSLRGNENLRIDPQPGEVDLDREENIIAAGLYLSNNYDGADDIDVVGIIENSGSTTYQDVVIQFFEGDPLYGTQIGQDVNITSLLPYSTAEATVIWHGFTNQSHLYVVVDPHNAIQEENENDNTDSLAVTMLDNIPWVWQTVDGLCHYGSLSMMFNYYGADHTVHETVELSGCPHSTLYMDDRFMFLGGVLSLCQTESDIEYAGQIRNLDADFRAETNWNLFLTELKAAIDVGSPVETSVDPYYLPQPDWDILRLYDIHSAHAVVCVGYTDSTVIVNDPGVGISMLSLPPLPNPENRGAYVIVELDAFKLAVESTMGTPYLLVSFTPTGPMPAQETMLEDALEKSIQRLDGITEAYDPFWTTGWPPEWQLILGKDTYTALQQDMTMDCFEAAFDSVLALAGGDVGIAVNAMGSMGMGFSECQLGWEASADYYGTLEYPQADDIHYYSQQLGSLAENMWMNYSQMLTAIFLAGGNTAVAEPYLTQIDTNLDEVIPLQDSVYANINSLYEFLVGIEEWKTQTSMPSITELHQNYPNPFNPVTTIRFGLPHSGQVSLNVYNLQGQHVTQLLDEFKQAGNHEVMLDAHDLASGIYISRLQVGEFTESRKMVLVR